MDTFPATSHEAINEQAVDKYYANLDQLLAQSAAPMMAASNDEDRKMAMSGLARELLMAPNQEHLWRGLWRVRDAFGSQGSPTAQPQDTDGAMDAQARLNLLGEICRQGMTTHPEMVRAAMLTLTDANENRARPAFQPFDWSQPATPDNDQPRQAPLRDILESRRAAPTQPGSTLDGQARMRVPSP